MSIRVVSNGKHVFHRNETGNLRQVFLFHICGSYVVYSGAAKSIVLPEDGTEQAVHSNRRLLLDIKKRREPGPIDLAKSQDSYAI